MRAFLILAFAASLSAADTVVLKDGRTYEGVIVEDTDTQLKIKTAKATLTFKKDQVQSVEKKKSTHGDREAKLEALDPADPAAYLAMAEWLTGPGKEASDLKTLKRVCNIAARLKKEQACRAQLIYARAAQEAGLKDDAARAYMRANNADGHNNEEARRRWAESRVELEEATKRDMKDIAQALDHVLHSRYPEALAALRKTKGLLFANRAIDTMGFSLENLADEMQRRVPCRTCNGKATGPCVPCSGKGIIRCNVCDGTGKKKGFKAGDGDANFADVVCRSCLGIGSILCVKCKAEREVTVAFLGTSGLAPAVTVACTAGRERDQLRTEFDLVRYSRSSDGRDRVSSIAAAAVSKGGVAPCVTCRGILFDPPTTPPDIAAVKKFKAEIDDRLSGRTPVEVGAPELYDEALLEDGCFRYKAGKWIE